MHVRCQGLAAKLIEASVTKEMFEENATDPIETKTQTAHLLDQRNNQLVQPLRSERETGNLDNTFRSGFTSCDLTCPYGKVFIQSNVCLIPSL